MRPASTGATGHVWLVGMMGTGKSTVARLLAERLGRALVDLDQRIEAAAGRSVAELFATDGEAAFREREAAHLREVAQADSGAVIATGGGAPLFADSMARMETSGVVVWLRAEAGEVFAHIDAAGRPLLGKSDPRARWSALEAERRDGYARAGFAIDREGRSAAEVAEAIAGWLAEHGAGQMVMVSGSDGAGAVEVIEVSLGERRYPVHLDAADGSERRFAAALADRFAPGRARIGLCSDTRVAGLHLDRYRAALQQAGFHVFTATVPEGEAAKSLGEAERLADALVQGGLDRGSCVVALGGGVVGDLAGFVAAILFRGVALAQVPTTLLAMVDSSVGGKTGVNLGAGKNLVGAFHQPALVWADLRSLSTLPPRELASGLGEVVKHALLDGEEALRALERSAEAARAGDPDTLARLAAHSVRLKARVVAGDERELEPEGGRVLLNLGHTVGHALEARSLANGNPLRHGEAVALGLIAAARIGAALDASAAPSARAPESSLERRLVALLARLGLPADLDAALPPTAELLARLAVDKKRDAGSLRYIALPAPGQPRVIRMEAHRIAILLRRNNSRPLDVTPEAVP